MLHHRRVLFPIGSDEEELQRPSGYGITKWCCILDTIARHDCSTRFEHDQSNRHYALCLWWVGAGSRGLGRSHKKTGQIWLREKPSVSGFWPVFSRLLGPICACTPIL